MSSKEASVNDFEVVQRGGRQEEEATKSQSSAALRQSSGIGSTEEASKALLVMRRGEVRGQGKKRRPSSDRSNESNSKKKKKVGGPSEIRPTAIISAYCEFMDRLAPKICQWHRDAYCGSVFAYYIQFGAPAADRRTLELVLSFYNVENNSFSIPDGITGETKIVNFDLGWVHNHTFFPIDGEIICTNRDPKSRMWEEYFAKLFKKGKPTISLRKYVEDQLERLVESTEKKDIQDFVLLQILYQCSMIWCPRSGEGIPRTLLKYMDSIERVNRVAWGQFIYSEIIRGIKVAVDGLKKPGVTYIPGCMPLIPLWYYEMTGIKKYAYSHRFRPPMTNWVVEGEKAGSLRKGTIAAKSKAASVTLVEKPIDTVGPFFLKYHPVDPHGRIVESSIPQSIVFPPPVQRRVTIPDKPKIGESRKISKSKAKKVKTKKSSIAYVSISYNKSNCISC